MSLALAMLVCAAGGFIGGLVGVGGGILFVPAMTVILSKGQVDAEATSLLIIGLVSAVGAARHRSYGNVRLRDAALIGLLSPIGVLAGVIVANAVPERALELAFAALALFVAVRMFRRALAPGSGAGPDGAGSTGPGRGGP